MWQASGAAGGGGGNLGFGPWGQWSTPLAKNFWVSCMGAYMTLPFVRWILAIAVLVVDAHGYSRSMPNPLALAVSRATQDRHEAALLVVFAFRESSYRSDVRGDGGASCGAWQTPCSRTDLCTGSSAQSCFDKQAALALSIMHQSMVACPEYPLAVYASGSCSSPAGRRISTARIAEAKALALHP